MLDTQSYHKPVLADESAKMIIWNPGGLYVDGTLGGGGHARAFFNRMNHEGRLIAVDKDADAVKASTVELSELSDRVVIRHRDFTEIPSLLQELEVGCVDGLFLDLGVSSHQIDQAERGFSFMAEGPLDMRMDRNIDNRASDIINTASQKELERIIYQYGEDRQARRLAKAIVESRNESAVTSTQQLVEIIGTIARPHQIIKSCARVFQALRISVNNELDRLKNALISFLPTLKPSGRLGVISYHSLEDRIVKQMFREWASDCTCPPTLPQCVCSKESYVALLTKRPIRPSADEITVNTRARSAMLRVVERLPGVALPA